MVSLQILFIGICASLAIAFDPMENPDLFQGDMELTEEQRKDYLEGKANSAVPLAAINTGLWPKVIPYSWDDKLDREPKAVDAIRAAIADYHKHTCLRFVKRKDEKGYIHFYKGGGCSSPVGYFGTRNGISLSDGCWHKGIVMHEMAHSLGFYHEQSRPDRDHYVIIHWENISKRMQYNFHKQKASNIDSMSVPYDYRSIMHYGRKAFGRGRLTIETRDPAMQKVIGRRSGFSEYDILQMNLLYKCPGFTRPPMTGTLPPITDPVVVPTTVPITDCFDTNRACSHYKEKGYCTNELFVTYMRRNCPKICGFCVPGPKTTGSPVVTRPPVTASPGCMDTINYCTFYQKKGYCTSGSFQDYMKRNCPKTCNFCSSDAVVAENLFADACMDTIHYCKHFVNQGHCTASNSDIAEYMKRNCPLSCKFCRPGVATQPPLVTRPPVTVPFTTPDCMDTIHFCKWYQDKGYCTDDRFIDYMYRNCPKTCGICKPDAVVAAGAYADACMDTIHYCKHFVNQGHCTSSNSDIADYMKGNCPLSCKFCRPGVATQPPLVTRPAVTVPFTTPDCMDTIHFCKWYQDKGYCTDDRFIEYMQRNCPKTCGICKPDAVVAAGAYADACMDTIFYCKHFVKQGHCTSPKSDIADYMKRNCPKSCKFCKPGVATQPPLVTRAPRTVPFTTPDCMDTIHFCKWYQDKGYCTDDRFVDYMQRNCPKTCGICKPDAVVAAGAYADACMDTIFYCAHFVKQGHCTSTKSDIKDYMKRNCPLSCKFCKPGVATQPPLVTRAPRTVPFTTPDCMDTIHFCKWYQDKGYCTDDRFIDYMTRNCPKTCGICKPDAVVAAADTYADACMDTIHYCDFYIKKGYCESTNEIFADYMKRNCPYSCKFCKKGVATQPPLGTRAPYTVPFTTPDCMDTIHYCKWYQDKGYCTDDRFIDYMTRNCPKTCGICKPDAVMAAGKYADACMDTIHYCDFYVKKGYCTSTNEVFADYMMRNCPLSCKFCKTGVATQPTIGTRAPYTVPFTTPDCMDTIHFCKWYQDKGYCTDRRFIDYMTRNCPKTCGICTPGSAKA